MTEIPPLMGRAPISQRKRAQFERDSASTEAVMAAAVRKGNTCTVREAELECRTAHTHFELGCWLSHYADRITREKDPQVRIDCVRRIWESDITNPGYRFFTIFGFGERNFDACFEMGDGDKVAAALKAMAEEDPDGPIAAGVRAFGWNSPTPVEVAADLLEQLGKQLNVPDSHVYSFQRAYETTWNAGGPGNSLSAHLRPRPGASDDVIEGEIRIFLDEPRAILFAYQTNAWGGKREDLLSGQQAHIRADNYDALLTQISDRYQPVLEAVTNGDDARMKP